MKMLATFGIMGKLSQTHGMQPVTQVEWSVPNFSSVNRPENCAFLSPIFNFVNHSWNLKVQFSKHYEEIVFSMPRTGWGSSVTLQITLSIKKADNSLEKMRTFAVAYDDNTNEGKPKLISIINKSNLEQRRSELLPSEVFTIVCDIIGDTEELKPPPMILTGTETLSHNFTKLLNDGKKYDVTLKLGNKVFQAHELVLAARSSVFAAMFEHDMLEKNTGLVNIDDCDPDTFKDFLLYMYSGKIINFSVPNAIQLYRTADKYDMAELKEFCLRYMEYHLAVDNVCDIAISADQHNEADLFETVQYFFDKHFSEIIVTTGWENLMKNKFHVGNKLVVEMSKRLKEYVRTRDFYRPDTSMKKA